MIASEPLLSIIVPVYNVEKFLKKSVDSIIGQTFKNFELILVDDGSTDNSGVLCDEYLEKDSRIKVIHKTNGGLSSARNIGIDVARGEYLGFVDSDDFIEPDMYENLINAIKSNNCLLSVCRYRYVFENGKYAEKSFNVKDCVFEFEDALLEMNLYRLFDMGVWSKVFHRTLFEGIRFPIGKLSEDFYVMYLLLEKSGRIAYVSKCGYNYLQRDNSISRNIKINTDFETAARCQKEYISNKYPHLSTIVHFAHASSALTVYDMYLKKRVKCPKNQYLYLKQIVLENKEHIEKSDFLTFSKKMQFKLFMLSRNIYDVVFRVYKKFKVI